MSCTFPLLVVKIYKKFCKFLVTSYFIRLLEIIKENPAIYFL